MYKAADHDPDSGWTFVLFMGEKKKLRINRKEKKKRRNLDYFGGLVLDCVTTVSGVQSVIAECSLYICVHYILREKKPTVE